MDKKKLAIILIIICTLLTTVGQILWKTGVKTVETTGASYINIFILLGLVAYGIGAIFMVLALKFWELSRIHPFLALGFVWITIFAPLVLGEILTFQKVIGIIIIIGGVIFIGKK